MSGRRDKGSDGSSPRGASGSGRDDRAAGDEQRLVRDASRGDAGAVDQLLMRHLSGLAAYLRRHAGKEVLARESVSDLAQSVCREVLLHLEDERLEYRGEAEFKKWLYQAALLKIRDRRRFHGAARRDVRREVAISSADESQDTRFAAFFQTITTPSGLAEKREQIEAVAAAFAELPEAQKNIIELARIEGLSHQEIARRLGIEESHSRVLLSRAIARLATLARRRLGE